MESGTPGVKATDDGWLNRALQATPEAGRLAFPRRGHGAESAADAARLGARHRAAGYQAVSRVRAVAGGGGRVRGAVRADGGSGAARHGHGNFRSHRHAAQGRSRRASSRKMARIIRRNRVGQTMQQVAQLHKADIGLEVTFVDTGRMGQSRQRRRRARAAGESVARPGAIARGFFAGYGRPHGRYRGGHHVRIRPHRARKRQSRHRSRPCQLHVCDGRRR